MADLEFETQPPAVRLRDFNPRDHQRLVVNPFLLAFALVVLIKTLRWLVSSPFPPFAVLMLLPLPFLHQLIQYHCLDCGQTGRYPAHGRHACSTVLARWSAGRSSRFAWASQQATYWLWVLGSIGILLAVLGLD